MKKSNAAWCEIGGKKFYSRSLWERNFCRYLQFQKDRKMILDWEYEPKTFWFDAIKRGVRSYKPDFKVIVNDKQHHWAEVKGYMDSKSATKLNRMRIYYPNEIVRVIGPLWFAQNNHKLRLLIKDWEKGSSPIEKKPIYIKSKIRQT